MPTGYTDNVTPTTTFREFALRCARAFLWECRDNDGEIPILKAPDPRTEQALAAARAELARVLAMTPAELATAAAADHAEQLAHARQKYQDLLALQSAYERMLRLVRAYIPPTQDHQNHAAFMIEQLTGSIEQDCVQMLPYYRYPEPKTWEQWYALQLKEAKENVGRQEEYVAKERAQLAQRNEWVGALVMAVERVRA